MKVKIIFGYLTLINIVAISLVWLKMKDIIKMDNKKFNTLMTIISLLFGFVGTLVGVEMLGYESDSKIIKKLIPFIAVVECCVILYFVGIRIPEVSI